MSKISLLGRSTAEFEGMMRHMGYPAFRGRQLGRWIYRQRVRDFSEMTNLPMELRDRLSQEYLVTDVKECGRWVGSDDAATKYLIGFADGHAVESVLMKYDYGYSLCISTQVGCAFGCPFCASGAEGLIRDLSVGEILGQWYVIQRRLDRIGERISRLVYMGSGEPLANYDAVVNSIKMFNSSEVAGIGYRRITLSTVGLIPGIERLAREELPITLAISLHAPNDYLRDTIVPNNRRYPLSQLIPAAKDYAEKTGRRLTFEYAMIGGVNDHPELARELGILLQGIPCHVNLIPYNPVDECPWTASDAGRLKEFREILELAGIGATVRRSLGQDIRGACGQLKRSTKED
ncbi:MAG: 23S rRNA (adenine(2503)-C(2))-methyltransferase RlmN [Clostridia bacterium]